MVWLGRQKISKQTGQTTTTCAKYCGKTKQNTLNGELEQRIVECGELGLRWAMRTSEEADLRWRKSKSCHVRINCPFSIYMEMM